MSSVPISLSQIRHEKKARERGFRWVAGLDEAGRGPLAGPVVAAAVILPELTEVPFPIVDSKKLRPARREEIVVFLENLSGAFIGVGRVDPAEIDRINILEATRKAMRRALDDLSRRPSFLLIDGLLLPGVTLPQKKLIRGEEKSISIAAASVVAKVTRDRMMIFLDRKYSRYGFARHKGYGTKEHLEMLGKYGPCPLHRFSFRPVKDSAGKLRKSDERKVTAW